MKFLVIFLWKVVSLFWKILRNLVNRFRFFVSNFEIFKNFQNLNFCFQFSDSHEIFKNWMKFYNENIIMTPFFIENLEICENSSFNQIDIKIKKKKHKQKN